MQPNDLKILKCNECGEIIGYTFSGIEIDIEHYCYLCTMNIVEVADNVMCLPIIVDGVPTQSVKSRINSFEDAMGDDEDIDTRFRIRNNTKWLRHFIHSWSNDCWSNLPRQFRIKRR